jgi:cell division protein FtsB
MYLEAYKMNLVDDVEVLKKTEIFDKQGVLQRKGQMSQMQSYIQQLEAQVKKLSGDLQTAERETLVSSRKRLKLRSSKARLNEIQNDTKFKTKVQVDNLKRIVDSESQAVS